jgi:hypothetical protein
MPYSPVLHDFAKQKGLKDLWAAPYVAVFRPYRRISSGPSWPSEHPVSEAALVNGLAVEGIHMGPELVGYIASGLVLLTFTAKSMLTLRILAILSNFAFIFYGIIDSITTVLCLHAILLPLNITRLAQLLACRKRSRPGLWQIRSHDSGAKRSVGRNPWASL